MKKLKEIREQAILNHVPVMMDTGMSFLLDYIRDHPSIMKVLECGTAVGWSGMMIAGVRDNITVDTLEIDPVMYEQAVVNIKEAHLDDRVFAHLCDASLYQTNQYYDLFFIDAAKSQYAMYLEHFIQNSYIGSVFIFDNLNFHGMVDHPETTNNRSTRQMTRKILRFREKLKLDPRFETEWHPEIGDGVMVAIRVK
ncbi:MAG: methyltransferase [Solobacterium sp.]|nr:methyltransferase [Solobacterium sp.]